MCVCVCVCACVLKYLQLPTCNCEALMEIFRANLASMNQIMPNSQETVLKITLSEALVLMRQQMVIYPYCPYYSRQKQSILLEHQVQIL